MIVRALSSSLHLFRGSVGARPRPLTVALGIAAVALVGIPASAAVADEAKAMGEDAMVPTGDPLTGRQIYDKMLDNRFDVSDQSIEMVSGDSADNFQKVELDVKYMSFRAKSKRILSKTIAKYQAPQDVRHLGYLVINNSNGRDDQFIYRPSSRKVRRVNLRGEAIAGTDFSFEDIIPKELEDGVYKRMPDAEQNGIMAYVVEVYPKPDSDSEYTKLRVTISKEHFVALHTLYWDNKEVNIKELTADPESIEKYDDGSEKKIWIARRQKMVHKQLETYTDLIVARLEANPKLRAKDFSERKLAASH